MYLLYAGWILTKVDLRGYNSSNEKKILVASFPQVLLSGTVV